MKPLHRKQRGITLIEALVSMLVLALGILGLAAVQARMLVDSRTTNSRAIAIRLIGELNERIQLNPIGAQPGADPDHSADVSPYSDTAIEAAFPGRPASTSPDCPYAPFICTATQQAAYDVAVWRQSVADTLMGGRARVWQISPRQLQVVVAWRANENASPILSNLPAPSSALQVASQLQINATAAGKLCAASTGFICHIDFINIPPAQ